MVPALSDLAQAPSYASLSVDGPRALFLWRRPWVPANSGYEVTAFPIPSNDGTLLFNEHTFSFYLHLFYSYVSAISSILFLRALVTFLPVERPHVVGGMPVII